MGIRSTGGGEVTQHHPTTEPPVLAEANRTPRDFAERSVVKIFTVSRAPDYYHPWRSGYQKTSGGSGCIVLSNKILTSAHVVKNCVFVEVSKPGDVRRYSASVERVDHDAELALLRIEDSSFFENTSSVEFGVLPSRQDSVVVCGFPVGGNDLSATSGVVSRIEVQHYTHSRRRLLAIQVDAAINPGSSGGPVFGLDGRLVGLAFQSHERRDLDRAGYVIPVAAIERFVLGGVVGVPDLGVLWQRMENVALAAYFRVLERRLGVLVTKVLVGGSAEGVIHEGDVMTSVNGTPIAVDGSVAMRGSERVEFTDVVSKLSLGGLVSVGLVRNGVALEKDVRLKGPVALVEGPQFDRPPAYFIYGGLVFTPLSYGYLSLWEWKDVSPRFRHYFADCFPSTDRREVVLISEVLAHEVNAGYHDVKSAVVDRVNGQRIAKMSDVVRALAQPQGRFQVVEVDGHGQPRDTDYYHRPTSFIVLDARLCEAALPAILSLHGVGSDRSPGIDSASVSGGA